MIIIEMLDRRTGCPSFVTVNGSRIECDWPAPHRADGRDLLAAHRGRSEDGIAAAWTDDMHGQRITFIEPYEDDSDRQEVML